MKKHKIISILLTTVIATSLTACGSGSSDNSNTSVTLNLDMSVPITSSWGVAAETFASEIEEKTEGRYKIKIYTCTASRES